MLDDSTKNRYETYFGIRERVKNKGMPPKDWTEGSKSYFETKRLEKEK
jgi:hypothetical protein